MHARVVLGVGKGVLFREVSSVQECPYRERARFHCIYSIYYTMLCTVTVAASKFSHDLCASRLPESERDVNLSLSLSPSLSSALWTRHLLRLTSGGTASAITDLQTIISSSSSSSSSSLRSFPEGECSLLFLSLVAMAHHNKKIDPSKSISLLSQVTTLTHPHTPSHPHTHNRNLLLSDISPHQTVFLCTNNCVFRLL